jgi:hypothetical protein
MVQGAHFTIDGAWSNGRPIVTSWHALCSAVSDRPTMLLAAAQRLFDAWKLNILPVLNNSYTLKGVTWLDLDSETGSTGTYSGTPANGSLVSTGTDPAAGALVVKNIAGSGRKFRSGRVFVPGAMEADIDEDGNVASATRTSLTAAFAAFLSAVNTSTPVGAINDLHLVVAHTPSIVVTETKTRRVPDPDGGLLPAVITGFSVKNVRSGQRRRLVH